MPKTTRPDWEAILDEAHAAAREAVAAMGPENMHALDCGFAWVVLRPGTHPLAAHCRRQLKPFADRPHTPAKRDAGRRYGDKAWNGGWQWWEPGDFAGQAIGHHLAGARAFQAVLARHNISAEIGSRYD